ncbi:hypothetical protein RJ639_008008 [Escallonia herrerae]|uniref:Retrovirus-related Pol polyprotein from transposon TNT 1-94-like beta-barrel domain-containing protein n=1 Tax=Escallonia herrerae TaxID=1293975 RepID=A0AA88VP84_9ASTE|nr:hypothetical protein RJ639_008008 [Escallonia herrerae]
MLMENFLRSKEYWQVVDFGVAESAANTLLTEMQRIELNALKLKDLKAKNYLFQAIDRSILETILCKDTSKQIWDSMTKKYQGNARAKRVQLQALRREFEALQMNFRESVSKYFSRATAIANKMQIHGEKLNDVTIQDKEEQALQVTAATALQAAAAAATNPRGAVSQGNWNRCDGPNSTRHKPSNHMCGDKSVFSDLDESFRNTVKFGDNSTISVLGKGRVTVQTKGNSHYISNVLLVPNFKTNLLSVSQLQEKGYEISIKDGLCQIQDERLGLIAQVKMTAYRSMMVEFDMSDLGMMHYVLGIEVKKSAAGIFISQKKNEDQVADIFTKPLKKAAFQKLRKLLGVGMLELN